MDIISTKTGINGFKMRLIQRIIRTLPEQDDYGFVLVDMCRKKFGFTAQVYGRSDCDSYLGYDMTDEQWKSIRSSEEWAELDESCSDIDLVQAALGNIDTHWEQAQAF
jgi:hypothetical protein